MKQQKLTFTTAKRTSSSSSLVGKPQVPPSSKLVQAPAKDPKSKEIKEEDKYEDINIVDSSNESEMNDKDGSASAKPTVAKESADVHTPTTRSASKKSASSTPSGSAKAPRTRKEDAATETVPSPRMLQESNATAEDLAKKAEANAAKENEEVRELNPKDTKYRKHYTEVKKKMGGMPTIHGEGQNKIHEILRVFDDSYEYGPCIGMTRLERWERAKKLGFNPPKDVYDILTTKQGKEMPEYAECVFHGEV